MSETTVVNLFFTFRVFFLGAVFLVLPRVTRKGLLLGVYVGEETADGARAGQLRRQWDRGCVIVMAIALAVGYGISVAGRPVTGNLTGTAVLLLLALGLYIRMYSRARDLTPPDAAKQAQRAAAPLEGETPRGAGFARFSFAVCVLASLATLAYAIVGYEAMPDRVPGLSGVLGEAAEPMDKSIEWMLFFPSLNLVMSPFFAVLALLTSGAKLSVREGPGGRSFEAQEAFRAANTRVFSLAALLICGLLSLVSVQLVRFELGQIRTLGVGVFVAMVLFILVMLANLVVILKRYGQGGARIEGGSVDGALSGGLADNAHWVLGMFYVDRDDPSLMVEKRFGVGYALNYGNRNAVLLVMVFLVPMLLLLTVGLITAIP